MNMRKRALCFFLAAALSLVWACSAAAAKPGSWDFSGVDAALDNAVAERRIVGAVAIAAYDGTVVYSKAVGFADREAGMPTRLDTVFRLASSSKAFTAMAAAALISQGKLRLDDPVSKWLPYFTPALADGSTPVIAIAHLLSHTAGLEYGFFQGKDGAYAKLGVSDGLDVASLSLEENLKRLAAAPLAFAPGERWGYSLAIDVLGGVVAVAHGTSLDAAVNELVCVPLQLKSTGFGSVDPARLAKPYYNASPSPLPMRQRDEPVSLEGVVIHFSPERAFHPEAFPTGGAGMASTAGDMVRLLEAIRTGGGPVADAAVIREMALPHTAPDAVGPGVAHGLGWAVITDPAKAGTPQAKGTLSWSGVYGTSWFTDPANKLSVVILTNTAFEGMTGKTTTDVRDALYAALRQQSAR